MSRAENLRPAFVEHRQLNTARRFHFTLLGKRAQYQRPERKEGQTAGSVFAFWFRMSALELRDPLSVGSLALSEAEAVGDLRQFTS